MDEQYFDKKLKDILEQPPDFPVDPAAEADMAARLAGMNKSRRRLLLLPWRWPWLLVFPLIGLGVWGIQQFQQLRSELGLLREELRQVKQSDTLIQHTIYQYDTITKIIYLERTIAQRNFNPANFQISNFTTSSFRSAFPPSGFRATQIPKEEVPETMEPALRYTQNLNQLSTRPPGLLSKHPTLHLYQPDLKAIAEAGTPSPQLLDYFRPQGGLAGLYGQALLVPAGPSTTGGWSAGLNIELQFPRHQLLELNGDWTGHLLYAKDPTTINQYPMVPPNDPLDELHELKGNLQFLQLYTGIGQRFRPDKKLQPMVSLGIAGIRNFRQAIRYEFYSTNGEYKLEETYRNKDWSWSNLRLGTGIDWQLADRLSSHSRLSYQHNFDKNIAAFIPLKYWTIRLGLNYHFEKN